ncbi:MAG: uridine diphosphate-N-acetylglucosamine-binding protein YvcK [Gordonia sp. (in: high G+C Gram-positive bacteria)]|uniref:gluconeogenesis factor YvcK family protein n=1 Tax=Gordonia sp. (in: high G+C Gram-positive bacteria) TaxID=84139 RepID=UPI0039E37C0B
MSGAGNRKIVALGGGHGLYATLTAMRFLSPEITAVVTVADDGGSSGRLRSELDLIPPGDLRMALAALLVAPAALADTEKDGRSPADAQLWGDLLQHRFGGHGALAGHPIGNLLLLGLTEMLGDSVQALKKLGELFQITGTVLPMSTVPLTIEADVTGLEADPRLSRCIQGQVAVATTPGKVRRVRLLPDAPPASKDACTAIAEADLVVLGPGSWFSSVIPHVLVPDQLNALISTSARRMLIVNLAPEPGETPGFSVERHLHVLHAHADKLRIDDVLVDERSVPAGRERDHLARAAALFGAELHVGDLAVPGKHVHDPRRVADAVAALARTDRDPAGQRPQGRGLA